MDWLSVLWLQVFTYFSKTYAPVSTKLKKVFQVWIFDGKAFWLLTKLVDGSCCESNFVYASSWFFKVSFCLFVCIIFRSVISSCSSIFCIIFLSLDILTCLLICSIYSPFSLSSQSVSIHLWMIFDTFCWWLFLILFYVWCRCSTFLCVGLVLLD